MTSVNNGNQLHELGKTNLFRWSLSLAWDWTLIMIGMLLIDRINNWAVWIFAIILIGFRQHALAILGHEGTHGLVCRNRRLNDFLTNLFCFLPLGVVLNSYRTVHLQHHAHLGTDKDPELDFKKEMAPGWDLPIDSRHLLLRFFKDLLALGLFDVMIVMKSLPIKRTRDYVYLATFWLIAITLLFMTGKLWIILVWFISIFLSNWAVFRLRIWSEHIGTRGTHRIKARWWEQWLFLPHNTWYHYEHHHWPWIPFYNLPKARLKIDASHPISFSNLVFYFSDVKPKYQIKLS